MFIVSSRNLVVIQIEEEEEEVEVSVGGVVSTLNNRERER